MPSSTDPRRSRPLGGVSVQTRAENGQYLKNNMQESMATATQATLTKFMPARRSRSTRSTRSTRLANGNTTKVYKREPSRLWTAVEQQMLLQGAEKVGIHLNDAIHMEGVPPQYWEHIGGVFKRSPNACRAHLMLLLRHKVRSASLDAHEPDGNECLTHMKHANDVDFEYLANEVMSMDTTEMDEFLMLNDSVESTPSTPPKTPLLRPSPPPQESVPPRILPKAKQCGLNKTETPLFRPIETTDASIDMTTTLRRSLLDELRGASFSFCNPKTPCGHKRITRLPRTVRLVRLKLECDESFEQIERAMDRPQAPIQKRAYYMQFKGKPLSCA